MLRLNFEPSSPQHELAREEAMLQWADTAVENRITSGLASDWDDDLTESFRVWKFARPTVVLGRSSKIDEEVNRSFCEQSGIEVLRRCTGGASVVGGPGCLMYSVVVGAGMNADLRKIDVAHDFVMTRVLAAVQEQCATAERLGICDLTLDRRKFSGNSLRVARHHLLYHGTILLDADLSLIDRCLADAPRQPEYRSGRDHRDFVTNVSLDETTLVESLARHFGATPFDDTFDRSTVAVTAAPNFVPPTAPTRTCPEHQIGVIARELLSSRYSNSAWHSRR